ncbi:MAG: Uma2 family endonuclease [Saprospiraceae bacterium]
MAVELKKRLISVADYHKMAEAGILPESGIELINGEIIEMSPKGSKHTRIVKKLNKLLGQLLGDDVIISIQDPIIANDFSEPEPDVAILKYRADFYGEEHPHGKDVLLAIEIGDTSVAYDRKFKLPLYAESGVAECWLINLAKKEIYVYWQPSGSDYKFSELVKLGESVKAQYFELTLDTNQIFG